MKLLLVGALLALGACLNPAVSEHETDNAAIKVQVLFTTDGCTVYRFDDGNAHYFAKCAGAGVSAENTRTEQRGKQRVTISDVVTWNPR